MKFNENLKFLRKQANLTQEQLAEKLNVSRQAITKWEAGQAMPDIENLKEIAYIFSVSVDSLVGDIESKSTNKIKRKINDIGLWIFALIFVIGTTMYSIIEFVKQVSNNENVIAISYIVIIIFGFLIFVLGIKLYLNNTDKREIIDMKDTVEGKNARVKYIIKRAIVGFGILLIWCIIDSIYLLPRDDMQFIKSIISNVGLVFIIEVTWGIAKYFNLEKKVKELNKNKKI